MHFVRRRCGCVRYVDILLSRQRDERTLSGVVGTLAVLSGSPEARRLLGAACVIGVGRHTSMGLGECRAIAS